MERQRGDNMLKFNFVFDNIFSTQIFVYALIGIVCFILVLVILFNAIYINRHNYIIVINNLFNKKQRIKTKRVVFMVPFFEKVLRVLEPRNNELSFAVEIVCNDQKNSLVKVGLDYDIVDANMFIENESHLFLELKRYYAVFANGYSVDDLLKKQPGVKSLTNEFIENIRKQYGIVIGGILFEKQ